jgi:glucosamine-6-phosphate deaminase
MAANSWLRIYPDRHQLGAAAADDIADELRRLLARQNEVRVVFAAAPSQAETLAALAVQPGIEWQRVTAFHMDEYLGLPEDAPQRFGNWLRRALFDHVPIGHVHLMDGSGDPGDLIADYTAAMTQAPIDVVCLGIGVNGHIAFNDPAVADFADPDPIKIVELDDISRQQQVDDECFSALDDVPRSAVTLTVPTLLAARRMFCMVPGTAKADAVRAAVLDMISTRWPCTVLRTHPGCMLYLDHDSAGALRRELTA